MRTICATLLVLGLGLSLLGCKKRSNPTGQDESASSSAKRGTFTIGEKTTFVTGPVDSTGHIDYAAALNEWMSKDVTAENNANVAIWKILGPHPVREGKVPNGLFEKMGMSTPPATGDYFIDLKQYAERTGGNASLDALTKFSQQPWTVNQEPTLSGWLKANEKPLAALREAVKKTHYYNPLIPETSDRGSKGMISSPLPGVQACRGLAAALAVRAMLFIGHNQPAEAWADLLACHRLGRLVGRGATLIEGLVGMAIEAIACRGEIVFLDRAAPDAMTIGDCLKDLTSLSILPNVADKIDPYERFAFLDHLMLLDQQGMSYLTGISGAPAWVGNDAFTGIDWDPALENGNKWFDRLADVAHEKDRATRTQKWNQFEAEIRAMKARASDGTAFRNAKTAAERGEVVGDIMLSLTLPAVGKVMDASDRTFQTYQNVLISYAIVWYQRFNGRYPNQLADLAPMYLTHVPTDIFTGKELIYRPNANGFLLYSVGVNGRDDGARSYTDQPPGDDLVVRIPVTP